jgi:membrane-bound acyltransferase YfiQ involved in biofilm formation
MWPRVRFLDAWWRPIPWVIATFTFLWVRPEIYTHFENRWTPEPWGLAYYGLFFFAGTRIHRVRDRLDRLIPTGGWFVGASVAVFALVFVLLQWRVSGDTSSHATTWIFAGVTALCCWLGILGFLGLCLEGYTTISPRVRFVAEAAYWIYLVHVFLVGLTQLLIHWAGLGLDIEVPRSLGFTLAVGCAFAVGLASYRWVVRYGFLGEWLHGKRVRDEAVDRAVDAARLS